MKAVDTWCTSGWQPLRLQLYEVDKPTAEANLLIDDMVPAYTLDDVGTAILSSDSLALEFRGGDLDPRKIPFGQKAALFALDDGKATRVPFAAADAEDFTEQWLNAPWARSATVSAAGNKRLQTWHDRLQGDFQARPVGDRWSSFVDTVSCGDGVFQYSLVFGVPRPEPVLGTSPTIEVCTPLPDGTGKSCTLGPTPHALDRVKAGFVRPLVAYFVMRQPAPYRYEMVEVRKTPRPGCPAMGE